MEILELQNRIKNILDCVNNAKSVSTKRRYFVYLSGLVSIYNHITGENISIGELDNQKIMKTTFYENFVHEITNKCGTLYEISDGILGIRKKVGCEFREQFLAKTYKRKYLSDIFESFLASLGDRFYQLYKEASEDGRLFYNQQFGGGESTFDYQTLKSTIFLPKDQETVPFLITMAHEFGHVFEYDYTKCSRKAAFTNKFNAHIEVFSMLMELFLINYLKKIHFDSSEVFMMEEKYYNDLIGFASEINFAFSLSLTLIDFNYNLVIYNCNEANRIYDEIVKKYGVDYIKGDINLEDSVIYMYGGLIATIYEHYYSQDKNFIKEICKHFLDYEAYIRTFTFC